MDIFSATSAVLRRWYVALPVLLLTAYLAVGQFQSAQPSYAASASAVLLPPPPAAPPKTPPLPGADPIDLQTPLDPALVATGEGSNLITGLVARNLANPQVQARLRAKGATASYEVDTTRGLPLLEYTVTGSDRDVTSRTVTALLAESQTVLAQVQQSLGARSAAVYRLQLAEPVLAPLETPPSRNRALIATLLGGGALAFFVALLVDAGLAGRRAHAERMAFRSASTVSVDPARRGGGPGAPQPAAPRLLASAGTNRPKDLDDGVVPGTVQDSGRVSSGATGRD